MRTSSLARLCKPQPDVSSCVQVRSRHPETCKVVVESRLYDPVTDGAPAPPQRAGPPATRNDGAFLDYEVPAGMARSMPSMASISNMARCCSPCTAGLGLLPGS